MTPAQDDIPKVLVTPEQLIGYCIDERYRLESIVGGGGMGVVYRTHQQNLNRDVAIKLLKLEEGGDGHRLERFRREIDIVAQLSHPNIVRVFDSGRDSKLGLSYIVMELVDGLPLDEVMLGHRLDAELALDIAHEVCAALTEPHGMGIIHRDIKPANILVYPRSDDTVGVKVVDFGIARTGGRGSSRITTTGVVVGSPMYMAPEVARGEDLDARTDLYSLGVLLYEMITGVTPFRGSTPVAIMLRQAVDEPPSLGERLPADFTVPELVELVDSMLAKDKRSRPQDARAVLRRITQIRALHGLGRPMIEGTQSLIPALGRHRIATAARMMRVETEADPFSATRPWAIDDERSSSGDSFPGWLVPEGARGHLTGTLATSDEPEEPVDDTRRRPYIVATAAVVATAIAATGLLLLSKPSEPDVPAQLGSQIRAADPVVAPVEGEELPEEFEVVPAAVAPDAGAPDAGAPEPAAVEVVEKPATPAVVPLPATDSPPAVERQKKPAVPAEEPVENLEWIRQK